MIHSFQSCLIFLALSCLALPCLIRSYPILSGPIQSIYTCLFIYPSACLPACLPACLSTSLHYISFYLLSDSWQNIERLTCDSQHGHDHNMTHWTRAASLLSMDPQQKKRGCRRIFAVLTWKTEAESEPTMGTAIPGWVQVLQCQLLLPVGF